MSSLVLVGGLIGCGKSLFLNNIFEDEEKLFSRDQNESSSSFKQAKLFKIVFDDICSIEEQANMMKTVKGWRNFRVDLLMASEYFISSVCGLECKMNGPLSERSCNLLEKLEALNKPSGSYSKAIIFLEDNFYYRSMRYDWFQIAKRANIGFCEIFLQCPVDVAISRNSSRGYNIPTQKIKMMISCMEYPDSTKYKWEKYSLVLDSSTELKSSVVTDVLNLIEKAANNPAELLFNGEKMESQMLCSKNVIHQADNVLRKIVSKKIENIKGYLKDSNDTNEDLQDAISIILTVRQELLRDIRQGNISLSEDITALLKKTGIISVQSEYEKLLNELFENAFVKRKNQHIS